MKNHLTKIVATIGPSCDKKDQIFRLIKDGVNVIRFNLKHNELSWHEDKIRLVNTTAEKYKAFVGTLFDLQGPETRVVLNKPLIKFKKDDLIVFNENGITITHPHIINHLEIGQRVLADDGSLEFIVIKKDNMTYLKANQDGVLFNKKNFNIPGADFPLPSLLDRDIKAIKIAKQYNVTYLALSFVRNAQDINELRKITQQLDYFPKIIAKIETEKAIKNIDEIIKVADGIMVARGDLAVEISYEKVPYFQKMIIRKAFEKGIPVITATQMLQSMINLPTPTRAEVSDIANAFFDLTDAVMLSGETANGKYPYKSIKVMSNVLTFNEFVSSKDCCRNFNFEVNCKSALICEAAYNLYRSNLNKCTNIAGFLVFTKTGKTAQLISRYRPLIPIFTFVSDQSIGKILSINYGIKAYHHQAKFKDEIVKDHILDAINVLLKKKKLNKGQSLIVLHGDYWAVEGGTSTVKLIEI